MEREKTSNLEIIETKCELVTRFGLLEVVQTKDRIIGRKVCKNHLDSESEGDSNK